ncbi:xylose reductase [Spinellus fusiger]|nr:xylose reductase [Spinellus fusiger]
MSLKNYVELNRTGDKMPLVGFGCWKISNEVAENTVYQAIKAGYRLIDNAADYGNEVEVGRGINRAIQEGIVKREELFVVTKLWNTFHNKANVRASFDKQLKDLGLDYVDLYLIHFPVPLKFVEHTKAYPPGWYSPDNSEALQYESSPMHECWRELEKIVETGLTKNIGVSNFNVQLILDLLTYAKIKPAVLQVELHPYLQQSRLVKWVQAHDIQVTAYSSFGPTSFVGLTEDGKNTAPILEHEKHGKTAGQIVLRWSLDRNVAVIPKSVNVERMKSNHDITTWTLDQDDREKINALESGMRFNDMDSYGFNIPLFC